MGKIIFGAIMPHPPILVPEIGRERLKEAENSRRGCEILATRIKESGADVIIVITPHGETGQASVPLYTSHIFEGNFSAFGKTKTNYTFKGDPALALAVVKEYDAATTCSETLLDHGALVPLSYCHAAQVQARVLPVAIAYKPLPKLFEFGQALAKTIQRLERKVAIIASSDMSHRLTPDAPGGYSPRGKEFDNKLVELVKHSDVRGILGFDPVLADEAGQDALWSIAILLGAIDGLNFKPTVYSYEGPFGVGYMTAGFEP